MSVHLKIFVFALATMWAGTAAGLTLVENFELTNGGFTTTSLNSWKWGEPTSPQGPGAAHSGTQVWGTNLTGSYATDLNAVLLSPAYDLSSAAGQHIVIHWWQHLVTEEAFDFAEVQVSKNGGGTWTTVFGPQHGTVNDQWTQHTVLLDPSYATAGFQIRFRFMTDASTSVGGFYIDDLRIASANFSQIAGTQDFEIDDGGYVETGTNSSWSYGAPLSAPGAAFSGQFAWATNLEGFYNADEDSTLTSPAHDLSAAAGNLLAVTWMQFFDTEANYDFVDFEISNNDGATWTTVTTLSGEVSTGGWTSQQAFLPPGFATASFRLRFRLRSDEAYQYHGVAIDDIAILATDALFPTAGSFAKAAPENYPILFAAANFTAPYNDPDGGVLTAIVIDQLPAAGVLKLGSDPVALNDVIPTAALHTLSYEPVADTTGSWSFVYHADNFFGSSAGATVTLNILGPTPQVMIAESPEDATVNPGTSVTFEVIAVSSLALDYQWRKNGADIPDATSATYTIFPVTEDHEDFYDVVVSNSQDSATSSSAFLSVNDPVTITSQPAAANVNEGSDISFTVTATGTGRLDYQWFKDDAAIPDATFPLLAIEDAEENDGGTYYCVVTNVVGPQPTDPFALTVLLAPRIIATPVSLGIQKLRPATFTVVVEGAGPFTYQWLKDGFEIPGATESTLVISNLAAVNMGDYTVRVSNGWATTESEPAELQVVDWQDVRGTYQDVLERNSAPAGETSRPGRVTVTLGTLGNLTAVVTYDGTTHRIAGKLDSQLVLERVIKRGKRTPLNVRLQLDAVDFTIAAQVSHEELAGTVMSEALLPKHRYAKLANPAPHAGRYTVLLTPEDGVVGAPQAPAYLTGVVTAAGQVTVSGRLPSGVVLTCAGFMHTTHRLPLHMILGGAAGEVCGRLTFDLQQETPLVDGGLMWRHLPKATATFMPAPFVASLEAAGSLYRAPTALQPVLALPQGAEVFDLAFEGPITNGVLERWLRLAPRHVFNTDPATGANIQFRLTPATGVLTGAFTDIDTGRRHTLAGVVVQGRQIMGGFFRGVTEPGLFLVVPLLQ